MLPSRESLLERIRTVIDGSGGTALAVVGPRGSGRTTLLGAVAPVVGLPVALVPTSRSEASWPLSGLSAFLAAVDRMHHSNLLSYVQLEGRPGAEFALAQMLYSEVAGTVQTPSVVILDDADDLDPMSQVIIGYLIRRLERTGLTVVISLQEVARDGPFGGIPSIELDPVPHAELVRLAQEESPTPVDPAVLEFVARGCDGSPSAFLSVIGALPETVLRGNAPLPVPLRPGHAFDAVMQHRLKELSTEGLHALRILAASAFVPMSVIGIVPGTTHEALGELVDAALARRASERLVVTETSIASVAYWSTPVELRLRIHLDLAEASEHTSAGSSAWHASFASPHHSQIDPLLTEAREKIVHGEVLVGVRLVERACALGLRSSALEHLEQVVLALLEAAEFDLVRRYCRVLTSIAPGQETGLAAVALRVAVDALQDQTFNADIVGAAESGPTAPDPDGLAYLQSTVAAIHLDRWEIEEANRSLARAADIDGPGHHRISFLTDVIEHVETALSGQPLPSVADLMGRAERSSGRAGIQLGWVLLARALVATGRHDEAHRMLDLLDERAARESTLGMSLVLDARFELELARGRIPGARALLGVLERDCAPRSLHSVTHQIRTAELALLEGDLGTVRTATCAATTRISPLHSLPLRARLAKLHAGVAVAEGELEEALRRFHELDELCAGFPSPLLLRYHDDLITVLHSLGRTDEAFTEYTRLRTLAVTFPSTWARRALARTWPLLLEGAESIEAYELLLARWSLDEDPMLRYRTQLAFAQRLAALGQGRRSAQVHRQALEHATRLGLAKPPVIRVAEDASTSASVRDVLSIKERDVVDLVARGYKNQAIAHELYVSVRTVELRLTNIYRKTGVKSRFELIRLVTDPPEDPVLFGARAVTAIPTRSPGRASAASRAERTV